MEPTQQPEIRKRLEPWDELPEACLKKVNAVTDAIHKATDSMENNLATDSIKVSGQNWFLVSFVSPNGNQKNEHFGFKVRGVFNEYTEAVEHVKRLIKIDPTFDIFICSMYEWCLAPPDPEKLADKTYQDETLNKMVSEYNRNQIYAKEHFEERKREMLAQAAEEAKQAALAKLQEEAEREVIDVSESSKLEESDHLSEVVSQ
jgi:hypothetical protein